MNIINIKNNKIYLEEYFKLCSLEWGKPKSNEELINRIKEKVDYILKNNNDKIITILGLIDEQTLIGFISLYKYDGDECQELTPWYATMYVKKEYRNKGYSKILNREILSEAQKRGYKRIYLKTDLNNYYEKFGAKYMGKLSNGEKLYYINLKENS